jgi:indole-3-glycerol phosphate synthase
VTTVLDTILDDVRRQVAQAKEKTTRFDLLARLADAPPVRDFAAALGSGFGLIAEIKDRSPSVGPMRPENVRDAARAYAASPLVKAVSVLTNTSHFGMDVHRLASIRSQVPQPVLRKDFFIDDYQVYEARAFGADAILLMANVLGSKELQHFYSLALDLGMAVLFEVHTAEEITTLPATARIVGINSRKFRATTGFLSSGASSTEDFSLDRSAFDLVDGLPAAAIRVAESGITPETLPSVAEKFHAALVGTSLLRDPRGIHHCLNEFEQAARRGLALASPQLAGDKSF